MAPRIEARVRRFAKELRRIPTRAEALLWAELRARRLNGAKFRRQVAVGPYVADFVCFEARLIVELDGPVHEGADRRVADTRRDGWLRAQGFRVLRFHNDLILGGSGDLILHDIRRALGAPSSDLR